MGKTEKLYRRLDELEAEYRQLTKRELLRYLDSNYSSTLSASQIPYFRKFDSAKGSHRILWLSKEIEVLRNKLGEPVANSPLADIRSLINKFDERFHNDSEKRPLIANVVEKWDAISS
jgi:hypothetical protein